ncbi:DUF2515 family protein [Paenibacillus methanolicus]|uniref:DUF2515 family protein n=1 Tax=Paenibacillus methanolicus TaxID=582686 RepID=UPI0016530C7B|nr:DUF2515 family protein [Paenibacillus methanolicus]
MREKWHQAAERLFRLPFAVFAVVRAKWRARDLSARMSEHARPPKLRETSVRPLYASWSVLADDVMPERLTEPMEAGETERGPIGKDHEQQRDNRKLSDWERRLVQRIVHETAQANRNNVTRTEAYRLLYLRRPELHWALLAHLVSRNGGYNMTDLQAELLPRLLNGEQRDAIFAMLERANSLIFGDAYPQLLLYDASCREGKSLMHLLSAFGVSRFMAPVWEQFWLRRESAILTVALIVNEQHFIERRIVQHPFYRQQVLDTASFLLQAPMQLNAVFMPYGALEDGEMQLAGIVLEDFRNLEERIEFGKRLYAMLFGVPEVGRGVHLYIKAVRHTGSRSDYAPHLFTSKRPERMQPRYKQKLDGCRLIRGRKPFYSPELSQVWPDHPVEPVEPGDWFADAEKVLPFFRGLSIPSTFAVTEEHCLGLNKIEAAVQAAERLGVKLGAKE